MIGTTISHYKILEKLGEGGMGVVYKAHDTKLDRVVALKFLPPHFSSDEDSKKRFIREARTASSLDHPNICTIYEIEETGEGQMFICMAHYEGETLKKKIAGGPLPIEQALDIGIQIARGLAKAHDKGIAHRDIKPANLLVTSDNVVKVVDFGLAKFSGRTKVTKAGMTAGTAAYMSPEQALGGEVDQRTDVWSLGVVLYEMLTGQLPFKSEYEQALVYSILNEKPQPVTILRPETPSELEAIVNRCMEKECEKRYGNVPELLTDLLHVKGAPVSPGLVLSLAKAKIRAHVFPIAAVLAAVFLIAGYFLFNLFRGTAEAAANSLAVMYFENIPDPEDKDHSGAMLANLLITSLSQVKELDVTSREKLYNIQRYLTKSDEKTITPSLATQIAQQAGVRWMLLGTILQKEPNLAVTSRLIDVKSGRIVSSQRPPAMPLDKLFALADSLALSVMTALQVAPTAIAETKPSGQLVTTNSPEAYRAYVAGVELIGKGRRGEARAPLRRAIEIDSSFAMAYLALSNALVLGPDMQKAAEKAWELREKLPDRERREIEVHHASVIEKDLRKAIEINERYMQKYPDDPDLYMSSARLYADLNQFNKSEKAYLQTIKLRPSNAGAWNGLAYLYTGFGRKKEALDAVDQYVKLAPGDFNAYDSKADVYLFFGDMDSARYWGEKEVAFEPQMGGRLALDALWRQDYPASERIYHQAMPGNGSFSPLFIPLHRGRLLEAEGQMNKLEHPPLRNLILTSYERRDYPAMLKYAQQLSDSYRKNPETTLYGIDLLAWAWLKNGNSKRAYELLEEIGKDRSNEVKAQLQPTLYDYVLGLLEFEEGKYDVAIKQFHAGLEFTYPNRAGQFLYGVALFKSGQVTEAIRELEKASRYLPVFIIPKFLPPFLPTSGYWLIGLVKSHYWLGVAHEQQGSKNKAIAEYEKFLNIWKDADFESPELKDAQARLARLK